MFYGILDLPWWGYIVTTFILTHITIVSVTIYLHRHQAHRGLDLHPFISHFFRAWLWLTTGMVTKAWTAIHRKHHAECETPEDPHSPQVLGLTTVLWKGAELYKKEAENMGTLERYGQGTPNDWLRAKPLFKILRQRHSYYTLCGFNTLWSTWTYPMGYPNGTHSFFRGRHY